MRGFASQPLSRSSKETREAIPRGRQIRPERKLSSRRKVIKLKIVTNLFSWSLNLFSDMKGAFYKGMS